MSKEIIDEEYLKLLLQGFNNHKEDAFSNVYLYLYDELYFYANRIFEGTSVLPEDVIHDVFISIWSGNKIFSSIDHIKSYVFLSIKNNFRNLITKKGYSDRYEDEILRSQYYDDSLQIQAETLSIIDCALNILPQECAKVLRMFIDGYSAEEIAERLGKSINTVYSQKQTATSILRKKMNKSQFAIITSLMIIN